MIEYKSDEMTVIMDLEPGAYRFEPIAGTGKTYLGRFLEDLRKCGERCAAYTYGDTRSLSDVLDPTKYDVVLLDRYARYYREGAEAIQEFAKTGIVLIACNREFRLPYAKMCRLLHTPHTMLLISIL